MEAGLYENRIKGANNLDNEQWAGPMGANCLLTE